MSVLIVDDETESVEELVEALELRGMIAHGTSRPEDAVDRVLADPEIDSVVVDVRMPRIGGGELIRRLRAALSGTRPMRYYIASGHAHCADLELGDVGFTVDGFFAKPIDVNALAAALGAADKRVSLS